MLRNSVSHVFVNESTSRICFQTRVECEDSLLFLFPGICILTVILFPHLRIFGWILACVSYLFPDTGRSTALFRFGILQVIGLAQTLPRIFSRTEKIVRHQIHRSWFRHHQVYRFRLRHHRTFSRIAFLSYLLHGTLLSVRKKEMATREHREIHDIQQIENIVPLITCESSFS